MVFKIKFRKNKSIKKDEYVNIDEYKFDKKTNIVPKKTNRLICILFSEDKSVTFLYRKLNLKKEIDYFRFKNGMYMIDNESIHLSNNGVRFAFYLEGITTPIKMSNIERETKIIEYKDLDGKIQKSIVDKIKGLKFDAKILDIFANRRFAEIFTKTPTKSLTYMLLIFSIITLVMIGATWAVIYYFR